MTIDQEDQTVVTNERDAVAGQGTTQTDRRRITRTGPSGNELIRRVVIFVFGLIQLVIVARIVLLLLNARQGNVLVSGILDVSKLFVAPFEGILHTDSLSSSASVLDVTAIVALVGWTIIELIVIWGVSIFRRRSA